MYCPSTAIFIIDPFVNPATNKMKQIELRHAIAIAIISVSLWFCRLIYIAFDAELRRIPGPWFAKFSPLWRVRLVWNGSAHHRYRELHKKYGSIVRIAPKVVTISDPAAIAQIYGISSNYLKVPMHT